MGKCSYRFISLQTLTPNSLLDHSPNPTIWAKPLQIGSLTLHSRVLQSPLSGVTDLVFRRLVRRYAPQAMLYTEMVSATEIHHLRTLPQVMEIDPKLNPLSVL